MQQELARREGASACSTAGRLFYLAVPPSSYAEISANVSKHCSDLQIKGEGENKSWVRIVIEKPFGKDLETAKELDSDIAQYFTEDAVYRIDHYLGKELSQNMLVMRFSNQFMSSIWDNKNIDNIQVCAHHISLMQSRDVRVGQSRLHIYICAASPRPSALSEADNPVRVRLQDTVSVVYHSLCTTPEQPRFLPPEWFVTVRDRHACTT